MARTNKYFLSAYVDFVDKLSINPTSQRFTFEKFAKLEVPADAPSKFFVDNLTLPFKEEICKAFDHKVKPEQVNIQSINLVDFDHQPEAKQVTLTPNIN